MPMGPDDQPRQPLPSHINAAAHAALTARVYWLEQQTASLSQQLSLLQHLLATQGMNIVRLAIVSLVLSNAAASLAQAPPIKAEPQYFRYQRVLSVPASAAEACAILDAGVFAHAAPSLKDLRLYTAPPQREVPYAITLSEPQQPNTESARILNLGTRGHSIVFDLEMPTRPYTEVTLNLDAQDFLATATVSGSNDLTSTPTSLGTFTLFDLSSQHLSRNTTLPLQESSFRYLHIALDLTPAPGSPALPPTAQFVLGAAVPPSREAQTLYTLAAKTTTIIQHGRQTLASLFLPQRVPVERASFTIDPSYKSNFSRDVHISDSPQSAPDPLSAPPGTALSETATGTILRVHLTQDGREIRQQQLSIPVTIGSNLQGPATVQIAIDNGDDPPLPITSITLEMRQRRLCFDPASVRNSAQNEVQTASPAQPLTLYYGEPGLPTPQYDFARIFAASSSTTVEQLGPERPNPFYRPRPDTRPLTERHPDTIWVALLAVIGLLAIIAFRSAKKV